METKNLNRSDSSLEKQGTPEKKKLINREWIILPEGKKTIQDIYTQSIPGRISTGVAKISKLI
jgi:hypothetical protein